MLIRAEPSARPRLAFAGEVASMWANRRALGSLARHDLRRAHAGTIGGALWTFLAPLVPLLVFAAVFSFALRLPMGGAPYIYGFAAAYVPWLLLSASITRAMGLIVEHGYLVKRVLFPVEIIPADALLIYSVPHAFLLAVTCAACFAGGYGGLTRLLLIPYFYLCAVVFAVSAGLPVSSLTVVVRDFQQVLPSVMHVWFWVTPVAWAGTQLPPQGRALLALNPAAYVVSGYRHALMPRVFEAPTAYEAAAFWAVSGLMLLVGSTCFRRLRVHFWDCL